MTTQKRHPIIDHDAGVDDLAAIASAHLSNQFIIDAITICSADSFKKPATQITTALVKFLGLNNVLIAARDNEGKSLFPEKWRNDSIRMAKISELQLTESEYAKYGFSPRSAAQVLVEILGKQQNVKTLATGPLSNITDAIKLNPEIAKNIRKIYFAGGAVNIHGNVEEDRHDLS
jgi:purine nucleosidase